MLKLITSLLVFGAALAAATFVIRYSRVAWRSSILGWSTMALWSVFALVLGLATSTQIWGEWTGRQWARPVVYALINVVMWSQVWQLFAGQRAKRRAESSVSSEHVPVDPEDADQLGGDLPGRWADNLEEAP